MIFDARDLARAWLAVAIAAGQEDERPILYRTTLVEEFPHGVRLVATDGIMLLRSWSPDLEHAGAAEPGMDEAPTASAIAMDPHKRALGFCSHLLALASGEDAPLIEVRLSLGVMEIDPSAPPAFEGMESDWVVLEHPSSERLMLVSMDAGYPTWRALGSKPGPADSLGLSPDILARLGKLGKLYGGETLWFTFAGDVGAIAISTSPASSPINSSVVGIVMPVRVS